MSNCHFGWELALQVGGDFFRWDLKTLCVKNSKYESQTKNLFQMQFQQSHFGPLPKQLSGSLYLYPFFPWCILNKYFLWRDFFFLVLSCQISWSPSILGGPNFLFGRRGQAIFFHKAINNQSVNSRIVDGKIICSMCTC